MLRFDINFVFTIINLLILYFLLKKFLFGRVRDVMDQRAKEISDSYEDAKQKAEAADEKKAEYEALLAEGETAKQTALHEAQKQAEQEREKILTKARSDADQLIAGARAQAEAEIAQRRREARRELSELVAEAANKLESADGKHTAEDDLHLFDVFLDAAGTADEAAKEKAAE